LIRTAFLRCTAWTLSFFAKKRRTTKSTRFAGEDSAFDKVIRFAVQNASPPPGQSPGGGDGCPGSKIYLLPEKEKSLKEGDKLKKCIIYHSKRKDFSFFF
jgi:hypothetical protein